MNTPTPESTRLASQGGAPVRERFLPIAVPDLGPRERELVLQALDSGWITTGPHVKGLEDEMRAYLGGKRHVKTFTSATGALEVALQICNIGPGDEVIVPAMTFAASSNVVTRVGAKPVFVDVDLETKNIDVAKAAAAVTKRTKAIMPVHFAGLAVDMQGIYALAKRKKLRVVEDAAHEIGRAHV